MDSRWYLCFYLLSKIYSFTLNHFSWSLHRDWNVAVWKCMYEAPSKMGVVNMISVSIFILLIPLLFLFFRHIFLQTLTCMSWGSSPCFLTLPNAKLSHSLHLVRVMVSCHKKVCHEIQSIATQRNIFLISGDGQRSRWHIILSHTSQWNTKDEYSYFSA